MMNQRPVDKDAHRAEPAKSLDGGFFNYFSLVLADTEPLRKECFRLRFQVYVNEMKFERAEDCPGGLEQDSFDQRSLSILLRHEASGRFIGCVRLILADPVDAMRPFPFELACADQIADRSQAFRDTPRDRIGEVSRLAVIQDFRRRRNDRDQGLYAIKEINRARADSRRRNILSPGLGLVMASTWLGLDLGLDAVFVMMELRLARLLRSFGLRFDQVAEPVEYHGLRAPFEITRESLLGGMSPPLQAALDLVRERSLVLSQRDLPLMHAVRRHH